MATKNFDNFFDDLHGIVEGFGKQPEANAPVELAPGFTSEEIRALFFDELALREPPYKIYQLNTDGYRYYYRWINGQPQFYPSVTTLLRQVMPTSPFLIKWMVENGPDGAAEKRDLAAAYGTFMHAQFERLLITRTYDFDAVPDILRDFMAKENLPDKFFNENVVKVRKDVLAFAQFVRDYKVEPYAIEIGLVHPFHRYAGCIDLPCRMTDGKGRTFNAIVDFKSGRKGFWEEHEIQLHLYKMMWNETFPDVQIERVFNFSPKDWRKSPTYNLKDQTDSPNAAKIPHLLGLAEIEDDKRENTVVVVSGKLNLDDGDLMGNVQALSLSELVMKKADNSPKEGEILPSSTDTTREPGPEVEPSKTAGT